MKARAQAWRSLDELKFAWVFFTIKKNRIKSRPSSSNLGAQMTAAASCATWLIAESSQGSLFRQLPAAVFGLHGNVLCRGQSNPKETWRLLAHKSNVIGGKMEYHLGTQMHEMIFLTYLLATKLHCNPWTWPAFDWVANKYEADQMIAETCASCIQLSNLWCST